MSVDATIATWKLTKKQITSTQKLLLLSLADRAGENGECWPGVKRLMVDTLLDRNTIVENRQALIAKNLLRYTGEYKGRTKSVPVMCLTYIRHREDDIPTPISSREMPTACNLTDVLSSREFPHEAVGKSIPLSSREIPTVNLKGLEPKKEPKTIKCNLPIARDCAFSFFWKSYPIKKNKKRSQMLWNRKRLDSQLETILADIPNRLANDDEWRAGYICHPAAYLEDERWNDELANKQAVKEKVKKTTNEKVEAKIAEREKESKRRAEEDFNKVNDARMMKSGSLANLIKRIKQ